jgi:hypothetical protein
MLVILVIFYLMPLGGLIYTLIAMRGPHKNKIDPQRPPLTACRARH